MNEKIGVIGIGCMGKPMAANLIKNGFDVYVSSSHGGNASAELKSQGATVYSSVKDVVQAVNIIITVLPADAQVLSVYCDDGGVLDAISNNAICIDMTSCRGDTIKAVAQKSLEKGKNIKFIDAPVSGGVAGAEAGSLTIMTGCEQSDFELVKPILEAMGKKIFYTGELGSGKNIKMLNQLLNAGNTIVASEVLFLAKKLDMNLDLFMNVVNESSGGSWIFKNNVPKFMIPESYEGGFRLDLMKKDISLSVDEINSDKLCMPVATMIYQIFEAMSNNGYDSKNYNAISEYVKKLNKPL